MSRQEKLEVLKVTIPRELAEKFREYVAKKYGLRRGSLSKAVADLISRELSMVEYTASEDVSTIVGLGLESNYVWEGEDIVEALRRVLDDSRRRQRDTRSTLQEK